MDTEFENFDFTSLISITLPEAQQLQRIICSIHVNRVISLERWIKLYLTSFDICDYSNVTKKILIYYKENCDKKDGDLVNLWHSLHHAGRYAMAYEFGSILSTNSIKEVFYSNESNVNIRHAIVAGLCVRRMFQLASELKADIGQYPDTPNGRIRNESLNRFLANLDRASLE